MSQILIANCNLFSLEVLICAPRDRIAPAQTLRLSNVISFTCICNCEARFGTYKDMQNHKTIAHPDWGGTYMKSIQANNESVDHHQQQQCNQHGQDLKYDSEPDNVITSIARGTSIPEKRINDADSNSGNHGNWIGNLIMNPVRQTEIEVDTLAPVVTLENEGCHDSMIEKYLDEKDLDGDPCLDDDGVKSASKKQQTSGDFACTHCPKTFPSEMGLNNHLRVHKNDGSYLCTECSVQFTNRRALEEHALQHPGYKPFICSICKTSVIRFKSLVKHFKKKHGQAAYHCVLMKHKRMKSGCQECKLCGKSFQQITEPKDLDSRLSNSEDNDASIDIGESENLGSAKTLINSDHQDMVVVEGDKGEADIVRDNEKFCVVDSWNSGDTLDKPVCNVSEHRHSTDFLSAGNLHDQNWVESIRSDLSCEADKPAGLGVIDSSGDRNDANDSSSDAVVSIDGLVSISSEEASHSNGSGSNLESGKGHLKQAVRWRNDNDLSVGNLSNTAYDLDGPGVRPELASPEQSTTSGVPFSRMDVIDRDHDYVVRQQDGIGIHTADSEFSSGTNVLSSKSEERNGCDGEESTGDVLQTSRNEENPVTGEVSCSVCHKVFSSNHSLGNHMRVHTDDMTYKCAVCSDTFVNRLGLENHIKFHPGYAPFICTRCGQSYPLARSLQKHMKAKHNSTVYECQIATNQIIPHVEEKVKKGTSEQLMFQCSECHKKCVTHQELTHHATLHPWYKSNRDKPYECVECDDMFVSASELAEHAKNCHFGFNPFNCYQCDSTFSSREQFQEHHQSHPGGLFVCSICQKTNKTRALLRKHMLRHTRPFRCTQCDKTFASNTSLRDHITIHSEVKAVKCDICDRRFRTMRRYKIHRKTHLDDRQFVCRMCKKGFNHKYALTVHLRSHMARKDKPHECPVCQKRFLKLSTLQIHERSHTGEKPFACDICGTTFVGSGSLRRHKRRHNGEYLYQCDRCGKGCVDHSSLTRHYSTHTSKEKAHRCEICGKAFQLRISVTRCMKMHGSERIHCRVCDKGFVFDNELRRHMKMKHS